MKAVFLLIVLTLSASAFADDIKVTSTSFKNDAVIQNKNVFNGFGCTGENKSPQISWSKGPAGTKYYAVTIYDPDAPTGSGWWHWTVINIPSTVTKLAEGISGDTKKMPTGSIEARTDFGKAGYGGPCPPPGNPAHRYIVSVYALKDAVPLDAEAPGAMVGFYINSLKISEGRMTGKYSR
jgi:Raf kinase inhibitor-like YbhB/YbcL family protein